MAVPVGGGLGSASADTEEMHQLACLLALSTSRANCGHWTVEERRGLGGAQLKVKTHDN
jgi:hypothetical protein